MSKRAYFFLLAVFILHSSVGLAGNDKKRKAKTKKSTTATAKKVTTPTKKEPTGKSEPSSPQDLNEAYLKGAKAADERAVIATPPWGGKSFSDIKKSAQECDLQDSLRTQSAYMAYLKSLIQKRTEEELILDSAIEKYKEQIRLLEQTNHDNPCPQIFNGDLKGYPIPFMFPQQQYPYIRSYLLKGSMIHK